MTTALEIIVLVSVALSVYVYIGYPLLLIILSAIFKRKAIAESRGRPRVTLIVSCYNEADVIRDKIRNCLELDYPNERLEVLFVSDGSTDGTDDIVREFENERLRLIRQEGRLGKTMGLNVAVPVARGEIVVFSDANAMYRADAITKLVRHFNDDRIGYVVGAALYADYEETAAGSSENLYWKYEIFIKQVESRLHSVVGGDGAIYAIRKSLYAPLDREDINDFVNPLQIIAQGYRGLFDQDAICYESTAGDFDREASRKRRIVNRSFTAILKNKSLLNPFRYGFFSFELLSHKVLRWLIPVFLLLAASGVIVLALAGETLYQLVLLAGIVFTWTIMLGSLLADVRGIPAVALYPYYFWIVNYNALLGICDALRGRVQVTWSTPRAKATDRSQDLKIKIVVSLLAFAGSAWFFLHVSQALAGAHG